MRGANVYGFEGQGHSPAREEKDRAIDTAKASGLEAALTKLHASLSKPRGTQDLAIIMQRLGRLKQRYARAAQHFDITVATDPEGHRVTAITWVKRIKPGSAAAHPGVYCLRTTLVDQDNATLWRTYIMLTELESVFRSPLMARSNSPARGHPKFPQAARLDYDGSAFMAMRAAASLSL